VKRGFVAVGISCAFLAFAQALPACGSDTADFLLRDFDAGADVAVPPAADAETVDPTLGGPCIEDAQCDDGIACTFDACDKTLARCRNTPDSTQCTDGRFCNGAEVCVVRQGCVAGDVITCNDETACTIDACVEVSKTCVHATRDVDGDGDPDGHCTGAAGDCDDTDPTVSSKHVEVCNNFKDDDCDGEVDETPCSTAANDTCATALAVTAPGTFLLSTVAAQKDYPTTCDVATPAAGHDIVLAVDVPATKNVRVRAVTHDPGGEVAVSLEPTCGVATASCGHVAGAEEARAIARNVTGTIYAVVTTQAETAVDVAVELLDPAPKPTNEACGNAAAIAVDTPIAISLVDPAKDLASTCASATGELTYAFTLTEPHDIRIFATTTLGDGDPVVTLRNAGCTTERACRSGATPPVFARNLAAGTYVVGVSGTSQIDASIVVRTYPPTAAPANGTCATAPALVPNTTFTVDLGASESTLMTGCLAGAPSAAYALTLTEPSDVLVVGRFEDDDMGAIALTAANCPPADVAACNKDATTPLRITKRNLPAGEYRVLVASRNGATASLGVLVRPTVAPVTVTSDGCVGTQAIPASGGFFIGDTTNATADFTAGCDALGQPTGGAKDQLLQLVLTERRRVVFDMTGSLYTTLLDVRSGTACPGIELENGCSTLGASQAFRDLTLDPGTYFVQIDGFGGSVGAWNLDVRVLPP